jgi:hypothetical protein
VHYLRIWADAAGESHLEEVTRPVVVQPAEPGVAALHLAHPVPVDRAQFLELDGDLQDPDWHTAPRRQFVVFLDGWVRIEVSDGEVRTLPAGSAVLVEDLHGRGHVTTHEPGPRRVLLLPLDPD